MTEAPNKHTPGHWHRYARGPRIRVSATGQSTGPYYTKDTVEYVRADIADEMLAALKHAVAEWDYPADALDKHAILAMRAAIAKADWRNLLNIAPVHVTGALAALRAIVDYGHDIHCPVTDPSLKEVKCSCHVQYAVSAIAEAEPEEAK